MKKGKFKKGDVVFNKFLGKGRVVYNKSFLTMVKWDKNPPYRYNLGENPCAVFTDNLTKEV